MSYLKLKYGNSCDLGNINYAGGWQNIVYFDTTIGTPTFEDEQEGFENGDGVFIKTSQRLIKKYQFVIVAPEYIADAMKAMALCDNVQISDTDGLFFHQARNVEVDVAWEDISNGCMATITIKYQTGDAIVNSSCCVNM